MQKLQECVNLRHTTLEKESSNMGTKERMQSTRNYPNCIIEEFFKPIHLSELTQVEKYKAMNSLIFLTEKRDGAIKQERAPTELHNGRKSTNMMPPALQ